MSKYCAPLLDMTYHLSRTPLEDSESAELILDQAAQHAQDVWSPVNALGDKHGCNFQNGEVSLHPDLKAALEQYTNNGWLGLTMPEQFGGQAQPEAIASKVGEMLTSSNQSLCMFSALTMSACKALIGFASDEIKNTYLPNMVSGKWLGTMCLTEAHCGSDLGLIKSKAKHNIDSSYSISGTKIFISTGEHNASENIIHLVLARTESAPSGIKGLSLFIVPKLLPDTNDRNAVSCIGIEEKMGIHSNPTCTMAFEEAKGWLIGKENEGIKAMFKMMNEMRLGTALQGVGLSQNALQLSYEYASERTQGQNLDKDITSNNPSPLINHADVRRMILTQKAFAEGGRALTHYCATLLDHENNSTEQSDQINKQLGFLTPIAKAFLTETGLESASNAIQVFGGHGFITETGVEQIYRDGRISTLYEGTTGIQALDLLGRKVLGDQGKALLSFTKMLYKLSKHVEESEAKALQDLAKQLAVLSKEWPLLSQEIGMKALSNHAEVGAASYDFLMYSGYAALAYFWLDMALDATTKLNEGHSDFPEAFLKSKIKTAIFYFDRILPRAEAYKLALKKGKGSMTTFQADEWLF